MQIELSDELMDLLLLGVKAKIREAAGGDPELAKLALKGLAAELRESALKELASE